MLDLCPPGVLVGMIHPRMSEPHTTGQCQGIAVAGLRSEGLVAIPGMINTRCRAQLGNFEPLTMRL